MAISRLPDQPDIATVVMGALKPWRLKENVPAAPQIADHLIGLLESCGSGEPPSLRLPSPMALAAFYRRGILDVLDGLYEMKQRRYEYVTGGLDHEVIVHDPLSRKAHPHVVWPMFTDGWQSPWQPGSRRRDPEGEG